MRTGRGRVEKHIHHDVDQNFEPDTMPKGHAGQDPKGLLSIYVGPLEAQSLNQTLVRRMSSTTKILGNILTNHQ